MSSIGLIDWLFGFLGLRSEVANNTIDLDNKVLEVNPTDGTVEQFVVTPYGYRIRVPQPLDVSHSVGEMLPEVRQSLAEIPPLPRVVIELMREIQNSTSTSDSVGHIASTDPVLAAALLRTVNSSAMGLKRKITSVTEAVSYLGFGLVKSVLLRLRLDESLPTTGPAAMAAENLWIHSLAVSYVAEVLADRVAGVDRGFVSTLGLLHDIGKLAMNSQPTLVRQLLPTHATNDFLDEDGRSREARLLGTDHAGLGASLAHTWGLPSDLVQAIRFHHHPEKAFEATDPLTLRQAAYVLFIANQLVKLGYAHSDDMEIDEIPAEAAEILRIDTSIESLLNDKVRLAITRAILFARENSKQPKTSVKRLLRMRSGAEAIKLATTFTGEATTRVSIDDDLVTVLFDKESREAGAVRSIGATRESEIAKLIDSGLFLQKKLDLPVHLAGPATELLRCLLPNLIRGLPTREVDLVQQYTDGTLFIAVRSDALKFTDRLSPEATADQGIQLLAAEFANLMNLGWVNAVNVSTDGAAIVLQMK